MSSDPDPVDPELLARLAACSPAAVADTTHDSVATVAAAIDPVQPNCTFAGTARTVTLDPAALWAPVQTLDTARTAEVIVVDTDDSVEEAIWGELLSRYATAHGVRGLVTNGAVRDLDGIADCGFPVFARSVTPRGPSGHVEDERNVPVTVGGVTITPGDVLVGDRSGVVAIDRDAVDEVTAAAETVVQTERTVDRLIHEGHSLEAAIDEAGMGK